MVDVYDVLLFAIVRVPSLRDLGISQANTLQVGVFLMNMQMVGLIVGAMIWGVLGDKHGRRAALFGSIIVYSFANAMNAFVSNIPLYAVFRVLSGIGLAGEVGAAMTIAAEITPAKYRTMGTAAVSFMGVLGSLLAAFVGDRLPWRYAYISAGVAGFLLLFVRMSMRETALFEKVKHQAGVARGSLVLLIQDWKRIARIAQCVLAALPLFFVFGVLVSFSPEITADSGTKAVTVANVAINYSLGETLGEVCSGVLSQLMRSRKNAMLLFIVGAAIFTILVIHSKPETYALLCLPLGFFVGYWAVVITCAAEQFGTNLRSTVTTIVPNLMRACHIPINLCFAYLAAQMKPTSAILIVAAVSFAVASVCVLTMRETFGRDLDFVET